MKKLIYTILAASIIFISCKKDEETAPSINSVANTDTTVTDNTGTDTTVTDNDNNQAGKSIIGAWSVISTENEVNTKISIKGIVVGDTSYTELREKGDEDWDDSPANLLFTADGKLIVDGDTSYYTYSGNELTIFEEGKEDETYQCIVTSATLQIVVEYTEVEEVTSARPNYDDEIDSEEEVYRLTSSAVKVTINYVRN
jgi:hypothetical protein